MKRLPKLIEFKPYLKETDLPEKAQRFLDIMGNFEGMSRKDYLARVRDVERFMYQGLNIPPWSTK